MSPAATPAAAFDIFDEIPLLREGLGERTRLTDVQHHNILRLVALAEALGCQLYFRDMGSRRRGEYDWSTHTIGLSTKLCGFQVVQILGHEIAHAIFRDRGNGIAHQEDRANRIGLLLNAVPMLEDLGMAPDPWRATRAKRGEISLGANRLEATS